MISYYTKHNMRLKASAGYTFNIYVYISTSRDWWFDGFKAKSELLSQYNISPLSNYISDSLVGLTLPLYIF